MQKAISAHVPKEISRTPTTSLALWQPSAGNPWDVSAVNHLYHRLGFSVSYNEFRSALTSNPSDIINGLLDDQLVSSGMPPPPDGWEAWLTVPPYEGPTHSLRQSEDDLYHTAKTDIRCQWTVMMTQPALQLREKLTLFWHNHFVVEEVKLYHTQMFFRYIEYLRKNTWGNFKQMVHDLTIMPAMLVYLSGQWNQKDALNENYARELMELFTMGRTDKDGQANYTQDDVRAVALAVTGWRYNFGAPGPDVLPPVFANYYFDFETKTTPFGSKAKVYGLAQAQDHALFPDSLQKIEADIIDLLFEKRGPQIAWAIAKKIYRAFVYDDAETLEARLVITELAQKLIDSNWELKPVFLLLFHSEHFFDPNFRGAAIKSPYEYMCGIMRKFDIPLTEYMAGTFWWHGMDTNQWLCSPPNVKGWPGYHTWLNSATLPKRNNDFARRLIVEKIIEGRITNPHTGWIYEPINFDDVALSKWAMQYPDYKGDLTLFVRQIAEHLCAIMPDEQALTHVVSASGILHTYEWSVLAEGLKLGPIRNMLFAIVDLPHFQLC